MKILFVCTGNICRSPIAERMLRLRSDELGLGLSVSSAGTRALNGKAMHLESQRVLLERGIDASDFRSRMLTEAIAGDADLVLGMTREHRAAGRQLAPIRWRKMFALREIALIGRGDTAVVGMVGTAMDPTDPRLDIEDPIGKDAKVFDRVGGEIESSVNVLTEWLARQALRETKEHQ
jgi:protein-tyrosine phosphatase